MQSSIENQISRGTGQFEDMLTFAPKEIRGSIEEQRAAADAQEDQEPALSLVKVEPDSFALLQTPDTYQQTVPGYTVMYVFFIISYLSSAIQDEKQNGTFKRLLSLPVSRRSLLGGKLLTGLIIGLAQVAIIFGVGFFRSAWTWARSWWRCSCYRCPWWPPPRPSAWPPPPPTPEAC